jgi:hypothetical protein
MAQAMDAFRPDVPSTARMYDYYLGGKDNYPADRAAAERIIAAMPPGVVRASALQNRLFLGRAVRHLSDDLGIRQFLDIGTGLPTMNSVHEVAQSTWADSRVVYVDHDPIVIAHSRSLLHGNDRTAIIQRDLRDPAGILADPRLRALLDLSQPVAVLLVAVLHFIADADDPYGIVRALMDPMPPGSCLVISHFTADGYAQADVAAREYENATSAAHSRSRSQIERFFEHCELAGPGKLVWTSQWSPTGDEPEGDRPAPAEKGPADQGRSLSWCGVGRKTAPGKPETLPRTASQADTGGLGTGGLGTGVPGTGVLSRPWPAAGPYGAALRPDIPNVARMYDYMLGGKDNYPADREAAHRTFTVLGEDVVRGTVLQNRLFLGRAVRYLAGRGIRQFLDIGAGLPTMNSVHEAARLAAPGSRVAVAYVDNDPVVLAHSRDLLHGVPETLIAGHDLRDPAKITGDPRIRSVLDFDRPIAVLLVAILHFVADCDDPAGIVARLMGAVPPGSCLVISHLTADHYREAVRAADIYADTVPGLHLRSRAAIEPLFCGLPLLPPGELSYAANWHPDADTPAPSSPGGCAAWCGVARKC